MTNEYLDFTINIARKAGKLLNSLQSSVGRCYQTKSTSLDIVTKADIASEKLIVSALKKKFPTHAVLAEEQWSQNLGRQFGFSRLLPPIDGCNQLKLDSQSKCVGNSSFRTPQSTVRNQFCWVIDPLDGTTNYSHGFPFYCVSIALLQNDKPIIGVVYNPCLDEMFYAALGQGAYCQTPKHNKCIKVSKIKSLSQSLLVTGFPYIIKECPGDNFRNFQSFCLTAQAIRRAGAAALDLCYVACGRFDGFWERELKPWDTAAGSLILTEAGGNATDFKNNRYNPLVHRAILASNKNIHGQMLDVINCSRRL